MISDISGNLDRVRSHMQIACDRVGRQMDSCELIAVSKTFSSPLIHAAVADGQQIFGESRLQEAQLKIEELPSHLSWHFIGRIQRNKLRKILSLFDVLHAVDSLRLAQYADVVAKELGIVAQVFLQVNVASEKSKGGFTYDELRSSISEIVALPHLHVIGLMVIPPAGPDAESARPWFVRLREIRDQLQNEFHVTLPGLSMGMSSDYEVAIEEGATHVRVGSLIFGKRAYQVEGELG